MNTSFGIMIGILFMIIIIASSAAIPRRVIGQSMKVAYIEAVASVSKPTADALYFHARSLLPRKLLESGGAATSRAGSVGGDAALFTSSVMGGSYRGKADMLHIAMDILMLMPLRVAALLKYLIVVCLFFAGGIARNLITKDEKEYNLTIDTSGNVKPLLQALPYRTMALSVTLTLLFLPLPFPIWMLAALLLAIVIAPWLVAPSRLFPKL